MTCCILNEKMIAAIIRIKFLSTSSLVTKQNKSLDETLVWFTHLHRLILVKTKNRFSKVVCEDVQYRLTNFMKDFVM